MHLFGKEHVERYEATDGAEGYDWDNGTTILLLHTVGRKSGKDITNPLIFREHDGNYLVVASNGGDRAPDWFLNLEQNPKIRVQIKGDKFDATARVASPTEKPQLWDEMLQVWPDYADYQKKADREIPVVVLARA